MNFFSLQAFKSISMISWASKNNSQITIHVFASSAPLRAPDFCSKMLLKIKPLSLQNVITSLFHLFSWSNINNYLYVETNNQRTGVAWIILIKIWKVIKPYLQSNLLIEDNYLVSRNQIDITDKVNYPCYTGEKHWKSSNAGWPLKGFWKASDFVADNEFYLILLTEVCADHCFKFKGQIPRTELASANVWKCTRVSYKTGSFCEFTTAVGRKRPTNLFII